MEQRKVTFVSSTIEQVRWGGNDNPDGLLEPGKEYTLKKAEVHSYHTKYELEEFPGKFFNSVSFDKTYLVTDEENKEYIGRKGIQ